MRKALRNYPVLTLAGKEKKEKSDLIAEEVPLTIFINNEEFITLLSTPADLRELAIGFCLSEGILKRREELRSFKLNEEEGTCQVEIEDDLKREFFGKRAITSGCGRGSIFYNPLDIFDYALIKSEIKVKSRDILRLMRSLQSSSGLFKKTGGVHSCALADEKELLVFKEDIGRHNAVDKIFGECFLKEIPTEDKMILLSGRVSSEILIKVSKARTPIVASRAAPTTLAVEMANKLGLTLAGFVRAEKMNIYTHPERIVLKSLDKQRDYIVK